MNPSNVIHLEGRIHGSTWSRWKTSGLGEVRFCVSVPDAAGAPDDVFTCAIAGGNASAVAQIELQLQEGRAISLQAHAKACDRVATRDEPLVLFIVESYELDSDLVSRPIAVPRRQAAHGKAAAAGDDVETFELIAS